MSQQFGNLPAANDILLVSGTNEVEILVFRVGRYRLGINVSKVREVLSSQTITRLPESHNSVVGCFRLRDGVIPCVSLHNHLNCGESSTEDCNIILTEFNCSQTAFIVDSVERIHRISWEQILPAPTIVAGGASPVTGVTELDGSLVLLLDFESVVASISDIDFRSTVVENRLSVPRERFKVVIVDDSPLVRKALGTTLVDSGYGEVLSFEHGAHAWDWLKSLDQQGDGGSLPNVLISDVEMPVMDGLHLTQNIKSHSELSKIPVILYSSIVTPDNKKKGEAVGADAQISKPELSRVIELADQLVMNSSPAKTGEPSNAECLVGR